MLVLDDDHPQAMPSIRQQQHLTYANGLPSSSKTSVTKPSDHAMLFKKGLGCTTVTEHVETGDALRPQPATRDDTGRYYQAHQ